MIHNVPTGELHIAMLGRLWQNGLGWQVAFIGQDLTIMENPLHSAGPL